MAVFGDIMKKAMFNQRILVFLVTVTVVLFAPFIVFSAGNFGDSQVKMDSPANIEPNTTYDFSFTVSNNDTEPDGEWIYKVSMTMPIQNYNVDQSNIQVPDPIHPDVIDYWEADFNPNNSTITWQTTTTVTAVFLGDIRETEQLSFTFRATTDNNPTDGFFYRLSGDKGGVTGGMIWLDTQDPDDDDDDSTNDDDFLDDDDSDDDDDDSSQTMPGKTSSGDSGDDSKNCCG